MSAGVAPAIVHLPRSLIALFPGAARRIEVAGSTVGEVIDELDRQVPGMRNRLLDAGPEIRTHINIYVSAERAGLDTAVPPGADVHIIPAVSGG
ncbi:MAG: molybdopterin synthase sulfur carrier subunit [Chloroflexi bacterium RBG_16_70_13]|nr:MAG: molybdopterin synthase sulfur carrier subunit [Chloroflexi bacterium RBG_16_70_13]